MTKNKTLIKDSNKDNVADSIEVVKDRETIKGKFKGRYTITIVAIVAIVTLVVIAGCTTTSSYTSTTTHIQVGELNTNDSVKVDGIDNNEGTGKKVDSTTKSKTVNQIKLF